MATVPSRYPLELKWLLAEGVRTHPAVALRMT